MHLRAAIIALPLWLLLACKPQNTHVVGPFYLSYFETRDEMALFRCPGGPDNGCAIDGLQDATVYAAGGDNKHVVVARHPRTNGSTKQDISEFFYFVRIKNEQHGWGSNPERIVGPLTEKQFDIAKRELGLPNFSIVFDDLK